MEDIGRRQGFKNLLFYLILCGCCSSQLFAATQGTLGRTSTGSAQISVHIPRSIRLIAEEVNLTTSNLAATLCLSVIDSTARAGSNFYRVQSMDELQNDRFYRSQLLRLNNLYGVNQRNVSDCQESTASINVSEWQRARRFVLMLVPE